MPSIGPSFCILGAVMVIVIATQTTVISSSEQNGTEASTQTSSGNDSHQNESSFDIPANNDIDDNTTDTSTIATFTSAVSTMTSNITITPQNGTDINKDITTIKPSTTPAPISPHTIKSTTTAKDTNKDKPTDRTGIIILVMIIIVALGLGLVCYFTKKRGRRYSVDFTSRPDDTNIPLSTVEPVDTVPQNGLQTFESTETKAQEPQEAEATPLVQEEQKAETDKSVDPSAESAAPAPSADSSEDKPKQDVVEQSPPAPVEPTAEEKTDDEGIVSNETSVESLKETNENNSNNADVTQKNDLKSTGILWDVSLDSPV